MKVSGIFTISSGAFLLISCSVDQSTVQRPIAKKTQPMTAQSTSIGRNEYAPPPSLAMSRTSQTSMEDLQGGYGIYMRKCGECHAHILPHEASSLKWHDKVPDMAWNAGLLKIEEDDLLKYLIAAQDFSTTKQ